MPSTALLVAIAVIVLAVIIYRPILRLAREDMAARKRVGWGNGVVYAILLIPLFGPLLYLLVRKGMLPK